MDPHRTARVAREQERRRDVGPGADATALPADEIEAAAVAARAEALESAELFGTSDPDVFDLVELLVGPVEARPNLTVGGRRVAGCLEPAGASLLLLFEAHDPRPRQRFSVAHELGHYWLHRDRDLASTDCTHTNMIGGDSDDESDGGGPQARDGSGNRAERPDGAGDGRGERHVPRDEAEANAFAAAFLLPADALRAAVERFGFGSGFLAQWFGVSRAVVRHRWASLGGPPHVGGEGG